MGVVPHVEALGWTLLIMTVVAVVIHPEKVPSMVQKSMIDVVETHLISNYVNVQDPLNKAQRNLILDRRAQDNLNLPLD